MNDYDLALTKNYLLKVKDSHQLKLETGLYRDDVAKRVLETEIEELNDLMDKLEKMKRGEAWI